MMEKGSRNLTVQEEKGTSSSSLAFSIRENGDVFTDYGVRHTKEMHLIIVRDDLRYFSHLHPTRDVDGVWRTAFTPDAAGTYWLYADFIEKDGTPQTIRFERAYEGNPGQYGLVKKEEKKKVVDGYTVELPPVATVGGNMLSFVYFITDAKGNPVEVEEYLGATGHSILISPSGDYIHAHTTESDYGDPEFLVAEPKEKFYRAFTQFQIKGKVVTVDFDWEGGHKMSDEH